MNCCNTEKNNIKIQKKKVKGKHHKIRLLTVT